MLRVVEPAMYLKKVLYCGLYNPQCKRCRKYVQPAMCLFFNCIAVCATRKVKKKNEWHEGYFRLLIKAKMGIFLNYGGAGSHHGGAGRITSLVAW